MRDKKDVLKDVIEYVKNNNDIKALLITSSTVNPHAKKVGKSLNYEYPQKLDDDVTEYLNKIYQKEVPFNKS